jgi:hypothetical protein
MKSETKSGVWGDVQRSVLLEDPLVAVRIPNLVPTVPAPAGIHQVLQQGVSHLLTDPLTVTLRREQPQALTPTGRLVCYPLDTSLDKGCNVLDPFRTLHGLPSRKWLMVAQPR